MYVYLIESPSGNGYVGCTTQTPARRWIAHVSEAKRRGFDYPLHRAIRRYGAAAFDMSVLEKHDTVEAMRDAERRMIAWLGTKRPGGYNVTDGGEGHSGVELTDVQRERIAAAQRGKKLSPDHIAKIRAGLTGKRRGRYSAEHRAKIAAALRGRPTGRRGIPTGWVPTAEQSAKMAAACRARRGRPMSDQGRANIAAAQQARRARERAERKAATATTLD